jgi:succinylglutamate desuccinylase
MVHLNQERVICHFSGGTSGPLLVCIGGLHGNEPSGVMALRRVGAELEKMHLSLDGEFLGIAGNLKALSVGSRFIREDLNRIWTEERIEELRCTPLSNLTNEAAEMKMLLSVVDEIFARNSRKLIFLDLHTTSAGGGPFTIFGDTLPNRSFASSFPVPMILGLEEQIGGTLLEHVGNRGAITLGFEAGPHEARESVLRQEAAVWIALTSTGIVRGRDCEQLENYRARLRQPSLELPRVVEVRHRHPVSEDDEFSMEPGFENFHHIKKGQKVAWDKHGEIYAPSSGRILLPLYQTQGSDGFFLVRKVWPFWLKVSRLLRTLRMEPYIHLLPGVGTHPSQEGVFLVNSSIARWRTVEIFHLLGYRRCDPQGDTLVFSSRQTPPSYL